VAEKGEAFGWHWNALDGGRWTQVTVAFAPLHLQSLAHFEQSLMLQPNGWIINYWLPPTFPLALGKKNTAIDIENW